MWRSIAGREQTLFMTQLENALITSEQASDINETKKIVSEMAYSVYHDGEDPEDVLAEYGLEPDYFFDLLT